MDAPQIQAATTMDRVRTDRPRRRAIVKVFGIGVLLALAVPLARPFVERWLDATPAVAASRLRFAAVRRGPLVRDISVEGRLRAAEHPTLYAQVPGICALHVREGEVITQGQVLAVIDSPELRSRHQQERSTLQSLQSDLGRRRISAREENLTNQQEIDLMEVSEGAAERELERSQLSLDKGLIPKVEFEKAKDALVIAGLELKHAREKAELRKESLDFELLQKEQEVERQQLVVSEVERLLKELEIRAPFDGLVARLDVEDRDAVLANQALVNVVNLETFEVEVRIPENYADDVAPGTRAEILVEGQRHAGSVVRIAPEVMGSQVLGTVAFDEAEPVGLRQSQRVSTRLILEEKDDVLKVPRGPFLESGGGRIAYRATEDRLEKILIEIGAVSITEVEIVSGLSEGERIVLSDMTLYDGAESLRVE